MPICLDDFKTRKLNIGCGFDRREGYINIDLQAFHKPDIVSGVLELDAIPSNWADEILAQDLIEHIGKRQTSAALLEWNRVLATGGRLHLRTTYLPGLLRRMDYDWFGDLASHKQLINDLFSSQQYEGDFHYTAFTEKLMRFYLWSCGFAIDDISIADNWLFVIDARKVEDYSVQDLIEAENSDREYVAGLYKRLLKREAEEEGLASKLKLMAEGASRLFIARGVIGSSEREELMIAEAPSFDLLFDRA